MNEEENQNRQKCAKNNRPNITISYMKTKIEQKNIVEHLN